MDWMYANCSTTAQRGALDWFKAFRDARKPVFEKLYQTVADGEETRRVLEANSRPDYRAAAGEGAEGGRRQRDVAGRDAGARAAARAAGVENWPGAAGGLSRPPSGAPLISVTPRCHSISIHSYLGD